jgi:hypothetical protein
MTVGLASDYTSATRYAGADRSNAASAGTTEQQEAGTQFAAFSSALADASQTTDGSKTVMINFQGKLVTAHRLSAILKPIHVSELPEDQYQSFMEGEQRRIAANKQYLEDQYTQYSQPDLSNDRRTKPYATVIVGGKTAAMIDNQGGVESDDVLGAQLRDILVGEVNGTNGPDLAQARAEQIAKLLGGRVVNSATAITQRAFNAIPSFAPPQATVDQEVMKKDPLYEQLQNMNANFEKLKQQRAEYLALQQAAG